MRYYGLVFVVAAAALYGCTDRGAGSAIPAASLTDGATIRPAFSKTTLYSFTGGHDGSLPVGGLAWDGVSHFWGVTQMGGSPSCACGVVFAIDPKDPSHVELYHFTGGSDGAYPKSAPIIFGQRIIGTTTHGGGSCPARGSGCGTVWSLNPANGSEQVVHAFRGSDGIEPMGITSNFPDRPTVANTFIGVAKYGGAGACPSGCGTTFAANGDGSKFVFTSLIDRYGAHPVSAPVKNPYQGALLFTSTDGGGGTDCPGGCGSLMQDTSEYPYALQDFRAAAGYDAEGGVSNDIGPNWDVSTDIYGTTLRGGTTVCSCGTLWTLKLAYAPGNPGSFRKVIVVHAFEGGSDGANPSTSLVSAGPAGKAYYGTTVFGGIANCYGGCGTVFEFNPTTKAYRVLYRFAGGADGEYPSGITYLNGTLYGETSNGGASGHGTIFAIKP
jgi:uncharacterized repeat protein (TIGR03803 family)